MGGRAGFPRCGADTLQKPPAPGVDCDRCNHLCSKLLPNLFEEKPDLLDERTMAEAVPHLEQAAQTIGSAKAILAVVQKA
jgi:hypothetical protein